MMALSFVGERPFPQNSNSIREDSAEVAAMKINDLTNQTKSPPSEEEAFPQKAKFEVYGEEMIEKVVKLSGNSGRVYLPPDWVGKHVKIIRVD